MRKKKSHRAIYGLLGTVVAVTAIGNVAAKETKPYKAPELRLVRCTEDYDLTEGITYDKGKYELMVEDTGDFDIEVLGKYTVEYSLTPLDEEDERYSGTDNASKNEDPELDSAFQVGPEADKEETSSDSQAGSTKAASDGSAASEGSTAKAESTEASHYNKEDKKEASAAADLEAGKIGIAKTEKKGGFFTRIFARLNGFVYAAELDETKAYALETEAQDSAKEKAETGKADTDKAGKAETKEAETSAAETKESEASKAETKESEASEAETKEPESSKAETKESETKESESGKPETEETSAADTNASGQDSEANASATATSSNTDGTLDEDDGIIYFDRIVRVVASDTGSNIEFDDPRLEIPSSAELFGIQIHGEFPVATDSNATPAEEDAKATNSNASKPSSDKEAADTLDEGFWVNENETDTENEAFSGDSDGATENGVEYTLVLKKPELLTGDAYFTDPDGKKLKKVEIKLKDAEELKDAVLVEENEKGVPVITGMELGTYTIELSAVDPDTEEEITCEREVEVVPSQRVQFDAPTLYIGTRNTSYDLTSGMVARDENGTEVTELYVVDETELLAAKEEVATASNANAETAAGQEEGEETQKEGAAGTGLKKGIYHAVIGAKHPVTGEEFTVSRKVEVIDGYYIYAPVLEIRAGSTDYDLTSGAEVRDVSGTEEKAVADVPITIEDISDLYRGVETGEEEREDEAAEETTAADENTADSIAAAQTDIAAHYAISAYAQSLASEDAAGSETGAETGTEAADSAEAAAETETTGEFKTEKPALQEGTYMITLSAVDPNTGEKIYMTRQVRVAAKSATLFQYQALNASVNGNTSSVSELPGKVTSWLDFLPAGVRGETLRDGGKADVTLTATENTNELDLLFHNYDNVQGLDQNASISIDGNNKVFAKDKLKYLPTLSTDVVGNEYNLVRKKWFDITIPAMQVEIKNFVFDGLTGYPLVGSAFVIEEQTAKIHMSEGSYLRLDNNTVKLSSDFDKWTDEDRAIIDGSRYGEKEVYNSDFVNKIASSYMLISPVQGAAQKYDLSVVQGSIYLPRYWSESPRNIVVDAATAEKSSPLGANNIGETATVKLGNGGVAELIYLRGAQKTKVEGTGEIKFRCHNDPLFDYYEFAPDTMDQGISTQELEVQDNVTFAKGLSESLWLGVEYPLIRITGDNGKITVPKGKKITVASVAFSTTPGEHDGGLIKMAVGEVIAEAEKPGILNPAEFTIWGRHLPVTDSTDKCLCPELDSTGTKLIVAERDPVWKISNQGKNYIALTFEEALDCLKDKTGECTLINTKEYTMTEEDIRALEQFSNTNVSLIINAGFNLYVSSFQNQELNLPKNVDVLFECVVFKFTTKQNGPITIVGNGGTTTFRGESNYFYNSDSTKMKPILYGGTKNGKETGLKKSILKLEGGGYNFTSIYNYDQMNIGRAEEKNTTTATTVTVLDILDAQMDGKTEENGGYKGVTQISSKGTLILPNDDNTKLNKRIGSLKGRSTMAEGNNATGALKLARPNLGAAVPFSHKAVLNLTAKDPLASNDALNKIKVSYTGRSVKPVNNDVVMYLRNVEESSKADKVHCRYLTDGFGGKDAYGAEIAMSANPADKTIILRSGMVALSTDNGVSYTQYARLAQALEALKKHAETNSKGENTDYILTVFVDGYTVDAADAAKMKELRDLKNTINPKSIIWTSGINGTGANAAAPANVNLSADMNLFGQANTMKDVILNAAETRSIFANGSKLTITASAKGTEHIDVYGGADGKDLTANTTLDVTGQSFGDIYGGSRNGTVTGDTTVTITLPPATTKAAAAFKLKNVSGDGVGADDNLAESATGKKTITIAPRTGLNEYQVTMDNLTGFDELNLGNGDAAQNYDYGKQVFQVNERFDSKTVDPTDNALRTGVVNVNRATLILAGGSGHIGQLKANGITDLRVNKTTADTKPLIVDQDITFTQSTDQAGGKTNDRMLLGFINNQKAADGDVVIRYTDKDQAAAITDVSLFYADGTGSDLALLKEVNGNAADIKFYVPPAHEMKVHVAYDHEDSSSKASDASNAFTTGVNKHIIVDYNPENKHEVKGGYLVRIPKDKVGTAEETDYTNVHLTGTVAYTGTYNGTLPKATKDGQTIDDTTGEEIAIYPMTATATNDGNGATLITIYTVPIDTERYFYVAHVMCTAGESSAVLVDVTGAKQDQAAAKDITVDYDADKQVYTVSGNFIDPVDTKNAAGKDETLPYDPNKNGRLTYACAGITEYAWAFGDGNGNADADAAAVAHTGDDPANAAISLKQGAADKKFLGATEVNPNGATYAKVSIPLTKTAVDEQKAAGKTYFYIYFKDGVNNTSRYAVPIDEHTIDVTVPTRVSLVAVKKPSSNGSSADSKLLAPTCYVVNHGNNTIKVQIEKFAESADNRNNSLNLIDTPYSNHDYNYTGNELALYLKATEGDGKPLASNARDTVTSTMFNLRNVLTINQNGNGEYAYLGDLKPKTDDGRTLDFTFTARYNPRDIEETNDWMTNIMSYRFSVVPKDTTQGGNQDNTNGTQNEASNGQSDTSGTQNDASGSQNGADNAQAGADGTQDDTTQP